MTHPMGSYSDWRTIAPIDRCPRCGGRHLRSRDSPTGLEVECARSCGYREVLADFTSEDFERWMKRQHAKDRS